MHEDHPTPCASCGHVEAHTRLAGCLHGTGTNVCLCLDRVEPVEPEPRAHARRTDPETSHAAAASLTPDTLRASQAAVLKVLENYPQGLTDVDLVDNYGNGVRLGLPFQSASGIRSRRAELVAGGLVVDTGARAVLPSGRKAIVWAVKPEDQA